MITGRSKCERRKQPRERRPRGPVGAKPEATGAIALALERAKLKK